MENWIIIFIVVAILLLLNGGAYENFDDNEDSLDLSGMVMATDTGKSLNTGSNDVFDDSLFQNVVIYQNNISGNTVNSSGIANCIKNCDGTCTEFGYSGIGMCFREKNE
jgi:hypothetical protein